MAQHNESGTGDMREAPQDNSVVALVDSLEAQWEEARQRLLDACAQVSNGSGAQPADDASPEFEAWVQGSPELMECRRAEREAYQRYVAALWRIVT